MSRAMDTVGRKLLTADQLAGTLSVPKSWIYDRTRQGQEAIPFIRLGAYVRFDVEEVISFFKIHGDASIINHRKMETAAPNESTHHDGSRDQVQDIHNLPAQTSASGSDHRQASPSYQKNKHLAHKRAIREEVPPYKKEARTPPKNLINSPEFGTISSPKEGVPNGSL
jgi:hypothetical protein